jgi:hypothetical protein
MFTFFLRGEKIDTFSYAFEGEMIKLLHNKTDFPDGVRSFANVQRQFFESFVGQTFKVYILSLFDLQYVCREIYLP